MEKKSEGAWLVHHTNKLQNVTGGAVAEFETISMAGKLAQLLSGLAASEQSNVDNARVAGIARAAGIGTKYEMPRILDELQRRGLIRTGTSGIDVLGVTTSSVLERAAEAFNESNPSGAERAVVDLAERASNAPLDDRTAAQYLGDTYKLSNREVSDLLAQSEEIGFVDSEALDSSAKLLFNGNLFRRESAQKIQKVLASLKPDDNARIQQLEQNLRGHGCLEVEDAKKQLGVQLFEKLQSIGMFDVSEVSNETDRVLYVTLPAAFSKFGDPLVEDAMDLAKAFVASLTYGMTRSDPGKGRITFLTALMRKLISGEWTGGASAIGRDYKFLEQKGVVATRPLYEGSSRFQMKLLKKDIGVLALQVLTVGDASEQSLQNFPGAAVTKYKGPEDTRVQVRQKAKSVGRSDKATNDILLALRTGKIS